MTINCNGKLISLESPKIMGILNLTPDSFFDGGKYKKEKEILQQTEKMLQEGAFCIDVGAYSSKPNAKNVSTEEELQRLLPIVQLLTQEFPDIILSIDTFRSEVAKSAIDNGAAMINDISGGNLDEQMMKTVGELKVPYILMHMRGNPQTMQSLTQYDDLLQDLVYYFSEKVAQARSFGINDIILDPGFGFAKTTHQNFELLKNMKILEVLELPLLAGLSRKSMIYKTLDISAKEALNGTSVLNVLALQQGAKILRVHDVKEARECIQLVAQL
ncbi:dihydropteroate synthase [Mesonia sp.]|uniref:dihydropteroate synthase n=1 Tax=Mesonia sp. TaxID=1960830 RepID=UPI003F95B9ED